MQTIYQPNRKDTFTVEDHSDLFLYCHNNGKHIRITVDDNGITILPINGSKMNLVVVNGSAGVQFTTTP